jgi:hypothetical protein
MQRTPPKSCDRKEDLVTYLYNEMTSQEASDFKNHLHACAVCREELNAFTAVRETLHEWEMEAPPPRLEITVKPTFWRAFRDFFRVTPLWGKLALGGVGALAVMALLNVNVAVGPQGVSFSVGLTRAPQSVAVVTEALPSAPAAAPVSAVQPSLNEATVRALVVALIAESEKRQDEKLATQVNALVADLSDRQRTQLVKAVAALRRDQRQQLASLVQENDRRDGLDLLDLIGQVQNGGGEAEQ